MLQISKGTAMFLFENSYTSNRMMPRLDISRNQAEDGKYEPITFSGSFTDSCPAYWEGADVICDNSKGIMTIDTDETALTINTADTRTIYTTDGRELSQEDGRFERFRFFGFKNEYNNIVGIAGIQEYADGSYSDNNPGSEFTASSVRKSEKLLIIPSPSDVYQGTIEGLIRYGNRLPVDPIVLRNFEDKVIPIEELMSTTKKAYSKMLCYNTNK